MTATDRETIGKWVKTWNRAASGLNKIKQEELSSYNYSKNKAAIDGMLQWACKHGKMRFTSGLIEQQRIFKKAREKQGK